MIYYSIEVPAILYCITILVLYSILFKYKYLCYTNLYRTTVTIYLQYYSMYTYSTL
jgi:hypothetical protein